MESKSIGESFERTFSEVSAYGIVDKATKEFVGRVIFKRSSGTSGAFTCWLQVWGSGMVKGRVTGWGFDKATGAFFAAGKKLAKQSTFPDNADFVARIVAASKQDRSWQNDLIGEGFDVLNIV